MYIGIREARPGMILAEEIQLPQKAGLIPKSRQLTEESISLLFRSGIHRISITDGPGAAGGPRNPSDAQGSTQSGVNGALQPETANAAAVPPRCSAVVAEDGMSARLVVNPGGPLSQNLSYGLIAEVLEKAGVVAGIDEKMIGEIIVQWKTQPRHYEFDRIAVGREPEPGREGSFHVKARFITSAKDLELVLKSRYHWEVAPALGPLQHIAKGAVVAEKLFDAPSIPGMTVRGEPVCTEEMIHSKITLGEGVSFSSDRKRIIAQKDGALHYFNDTIGVCRLDFNGSADISAENDKMAAQLILHPPGEGGAMPSEREIRDLLYTKGIVFGIADNALHEVLAGCAEGRIPKEPVAVAFGVSPSNGENGKVEFFFNTTTSLAPKVNPDGSVDYKNVNIINPVPKGKELARLLPPAPGTPGKNVFGEELPCKEGSAGTLPVGPNTEPSHADGTMLVASIDGMVRYTGSHVEVCEGYVIKGDVDFSTGNIKYDKSVIINGDIKAGFSVECGGDLQVSGIIEDCVLQVGGTILCKHGFVGQGKGSIEAKGDVNLGFILNQSIKSKKNVNIAKEAINSDVFARQSIFVHGKPLSVAGGTLFARESITVYTVGNQSGVRTTLEAGVDYLLLEELKKNEVHIADLNQKYKKLVSAVKRCRQGASPRKRPSAQEELLFNKLRVAIVKVEEQMHILEERKKMIQSKLSDLGNSYIKIEHAAMPGTLFKIGERRHFVKEELVGPKTVRLIRQEIHIL